MTPRLNDLKYFEKPPLQYWATAATYELFGVREATSRLWGVGLAFACLPLIYPVEPAPLRGAQRRWRRWWPWP